LHPIVREEIARIAVEAVVNALRHASAEAIDVELSFDRLAMHINVKDDGRGMEHRSSASGAKVTLDSRG
jgi:signal transduction histidine kinase